VATETILTKEFLHNLFNYCDGKLFWKIAFSQKVKIGQEAGTASTRYIYTGINKKIYANHRLIFMMHHGYMPSKVDHIDGNPHNNRIENLRAATHAQNCLNAKLRKDSKTGIKGVTKSGNKYRAVLSLGSFDSAELAKQAIVEARIKYHGAFANHG
jgi:hypothetical protein